MSQGRQFSLRFLMITITVLCLALFLAVNRDSLVSKIVFVVLVVNALGFLAGLIVTHVFGLPRDGSYSFQEDDSDCEA